MLRHGISAVQGVAEPGDGGAAAARAPNVKTFRALAKDVDAE
jgi:hypothetical protein